MKERSEEDDDDVAVRAGISDSPPNRKPQSYSQQLRTTTGTHQKRHQLRNHSLDEDRILGHPDSSFDEEFYPYSTINSNGAVAIGSMSDHHVDYFRPDGGDELPQQPLPEFMGSGGGVGIFRVPNRAAVNPNRPPCLELRPHPLRETQVGRFLRTIASTESQLWAGQESGVRVWNYSDSFKAGTGIGGRARRGDEDAAPFYELESTSPTICLIVDRGTKLVWSGHKDGKIRSWKMDQQFSDKNGFSEGLSWQAHRGPILSMEISSYGDIWTGSENGVIRVWPYEAVEKSLSLKPEEKHMSTLLMERSFVDLKNQVTVNGVCSISSSDVKFLLSDNARARIWSVGTLSFSLWDARTKELLKVFNTEGQVDNRIDISSAQDLAIEDELNVKLMSKSKKEKSGSFLQRSRNDIMGAADAVRRAASKGSGAFGEDGKRTEAIVLAADGMIWTGSSNGLLIQWDGNGNRLQDFTHHPCGVLCFCSYGSRIWVGYVSGMVQVMDLEGNRVAGWVALNGPVIRLVVGNGSVFSLATHGGIRGWNISSPTPSDDIVRVELARRETECTLLENVRILVGTWNVAQGRASHDALMAWLGSTISDVGIVVVGLQEVDMGAGFLAMSAAKETVGLEGSAIGQWWLDHVGKALDEEFTFERVGSRQLTVLMIAIWVRKTLRTHVGDLDVAAVACGLGRAIDVTESDDKPVRCKFNVDIARVNRSARRQELGKLFESNDDIRLSLEALRFVPETTVDTNRILLTNQDTFNLKITNQSGKDMVFYQIICEGQSTISEDEVASEYRPRGSLVFPRWLETTPAAGMIDPDQVAEITVHHEEFHLEEFVDGIPQSWWSDDARDKEVLLLVNIRGSCSTETKTHRIHVRHHFSGNRANLERKGSSSRKHRSSSYRGQH